ncbi:MAG: histidine phosphatase family protein [Pseudomonadota bacterium]
MKTSIILVTHALTRWNTEGRIQGHTDVPLNDHGRAMAIALGERMGNEGADAVYSSDLTRAVETALPAAARLGLTVIRDPRLREGRSHLQERSDRYPTLAFYREVEAEEHVLMRMEDVMTDIALSHIGQRVLVVSHGAAVDIFITHILESLGRNFEQYLGIRMALNRLDFHKGQWDCIDLNDAQHLKDSSENR